MANKRSLCAVVVAMTCAAQAVAADTAPATVGDLQDLQAKIIMARAQNILADETGRLKERAGDSTAASVPAPRPPVVIRVTGASDKPTAYLLMGDGSVVTARAGVTVPGGYRIVDIAARQVLAAHGGVTVSLGFATAVPRTVVRSQDTGTRPEGP